MILQNSIYQKCIKSYSGKVCMDYNAKYLQISLQDFRYFFFKVLPNLGQKTIGECPCESFIHWPLDWQKKIQKNYILASTYILVYILIISETLHVALDLFSMHLFFTEICMNFNFSYIISVHCHIQNVTLCRSPPPPHLFIWPPRPSPGPYHLPTSSSDPSFIHTAASRATLPW